MITEKYWQGGESDDAKDIIFSLHLENENFLYSNLENSDYGESWVEIFRRIRQKSLISR